MDADRRCHTYDSSCSSCIQTPGCQWCSSFMTNSSSRHRCYSSSSSNNNICLPNSVVNPQNEHVVLENRPLTEIEKGRPIDEDIVQLAPQRMKLLLRKGVPYNITFRFRLATDYPVDLYYLMDLSKSMEDDKDNLARLGSSLAATMRNLTSKFKLGFGSYVDKVVMPFANVHPKRVSEPCSGCAQPYSYRNNLPLDSDDRKFTEYVRNTPISGNVDAPEGGLDALMQAIVCWKEVGWRRQARRLLILSTDATFHHAGDGRGGVGGGILGERATDGRQMGRGYVRGGYGGHGGCGGQVG
ncbi:Integrin beta subunit VWA domain [Trinorchestia longiramus]|nr:Integrin beta subunit VWA domain [Trinorchestia longiramus]